MLGRGLGAGGAEHRVRLDIGLGPANRDRVGIGSHQASANQGRNFAVDALVRILDQTEVDQRDAVERGNRRGQRAVNAINHVLRGERSAVTELEVRL